MRIHAVQAVILFYGFGTQIGDKKAIGIGICCVDYICTCSQHNSDGK